MNTEMNRGFNSRSRFYNPETGENKVLEFFTACAIFALIIGAAIVLG